jgi:glycosyltransferase involved in cell wall biosynthesis
MSDIKIVNWKKLPNNPLVSVSVITYQHSQYIHKALDGVLMQVTDFEFELCLGEDGSTDGTREICENYAKRYSNIIRLFIRDRNCSERRYFKQPAAYNGLKTLEACRGKYIALCEGDDYWTDRYKLQRQIDFLKNNKECVATSHDVDAVNLRNDDKDLVKKLLSKRPKNGTHTIDSIISRDTPFHTCSFVFKKNIINNRVKKLLSNEHFNSGDIVLYNAALSNGKIYQFKEKMGTITLHKNGISQNVNKGSVFLFNLTRVRMFNEIRSSIWKKKAKALQKIDSVIKELKKILLQEFELKYFYKSCKVIGFRNTTSLLQNFDFTKRKTKISQLFYPDVYVFGTGGLLSNNYALLKKNFNILGLIDNDNLKWNTTIKGIKVLPPKAIKYKNFNFLIIASSFEKEIRQSLEFCKRDKILSVNQNSFSIFKNKFFRILILLLNKVL